jgi:hypothetical protein
MPINTLFKPDSMFKPKPRKRTWGFRFSPADSVAIGVFAFLAFVFWRWENPLWWMLAIAAGHFFLFCNVFRIMRRREVIWASLFILNVGTWLWLDALNWPHVLGSQIPITIVLILSDMRAPGYHGIFANRLNPQLNEYLEGRIL